MPRWAIFEGIAVAETVDLKFEIWCAWQESNLLPFGPEPNALSGELQARDRLTSLDCGPRGQAFGRRSDRRARRGLSSHEHLDPIAAAEPD